MGRGEEGLESGRYGHSETLNNNTQHKHSTSPEMCGTGRPTYKALANAEHVLDRRLSIVLQRTGLHYAVSYGLDYGSGFAKAGCVVRGTGGAIKGRHETPHPTTCWGTNIASGSVGDAGRDE